MGSNTAFIKLVKYVDNQIKIKNTLIALKEVNFEAKKILLKKFKLKRLK